jgi:hypothetical protein
MSWLDDLESRLDSQLEAFLRSSPAQEALLAEQERQDRLSQLRSQRLDLQQQADPEPRAQRGQHLRRVRACRERAQGRAATAARARP